MAAVKAKAKPKPEKSDPVKPDTPLEHVQARLPAFLATAAAARTKSLTLADLEYANDLAKSMMSHAEVIEKTYKGITKAIKHHPGEMKIFRRHLTTMDDLDATSNRYKARFLGGIWGGAYITTKALRLYKHPTDILDTISTNSSFQVGPPQGYQGVFNYHSTCAAPVIGVEAAADAFLNALKPKRPSKKDKKDKK